jgi:hypothetical protein
MSRSRSPSHSPTHSPHPSRSPSPQARTHSINMNTQGASLRPGNVSREGSLSPAYPAMAEGTPRSPRRDMFPAYIQSPRMRGIVRHGNDDGYATPRGPCYEHKGSSLMGPLGPPQRIATMSTVDTEASLDAYSDTEVGILYVYIHMYIYVCIYRFLFIYRYRCIYMHVHCILLVTILYECMHTHIHTHTHTHTHTHIHTHTHTHIHTHMLIPVSLMHIYTHVFTFT